MIDMCFYIRPLGRKFLHFLDLLPICFLVTIIGGCDSSIDSFSIAEQTLVVYMVADNDLNEDAEEFLEHLVSLKVDDRQNVVVFIDNDRGSYLYKVKDGLNLIKKYGVLSSVSSDVISRVLLDIDYIFPSYNKGLILWSHGTGWIYSDDSRSFGLDNGDTINIDKLASALPHKYQYIILDACYMSSIETVAALRGKTDYILASATVVPNIGLVNMNGMEYLLSMLDIRTKLSKIAEEYYNRYQDQDDISIALTYTPGVEGIIDYVRHIRPQSLESNYSLTLSSYYFRGYNVFYDTMEAFQIYNIPISYLSDIIVTSIDSHKRSGISIYVPNDRNLCYINAYERLSWNMETGWSFKFKSIVH